MYHVVGGADLMLSAMFAAGEILALPFEFHPNGPFPNKSNQLHVNMTEKKPRIAVYTGSFDPITLGHLNVIERSSRLVDSLIVGIGTNVEKAELFSPDERLELVKIATNHLPNVDVRFFDGLAVVFVRQCGAHVMIRGIRPLTDMEAEITMMLANRELDPDIETVFLMADQQFAHVSSSLTKQITPLASDEKLAKFIPRSIIPQVRAKMPLAT